MIDHTLSSGCALYHLHHASDLHCEIMLRREQRKAFWLALGFMACVTFALYMAIIYK